MKIPKMPLSLRMRIAILSGLAKLILRAITPSPMLRPTPAGASARRNRDAGHTYEGEFRRVDSRHNDNW